MRKPHRNSMMVNLETAHAIISRKQHDIYTQKQPIEQQNSTTNLYCLMRFQKTAYTEVYCQRVQIA